MAGETRFLFCGYCLCPYTRELKYNGEPIGVESRIFDVLVYLVEHRERAVAKTELEEVIWGGKPLSETVLAHSIMKARQALGDSGKHQRFIRTIRAFGYRFVAEVITEPIIINAAEANAAESEDIADSERQLTHWTKLLALTRQRKIVAGAAVLLIFGIVCGIVAAPIYDSHFAERQRYGTITLWLPPISVEPSNIATLGMRVTMLLDRRLGKLAWLDVDAASRVPDASAKPTSDFMLTTKLRYVKPMYQMRFTLRQVNGPTINDVDTDSNPFHAAKALVERVSDATRAAALKKAESQDQSHSGMRRAHTAGDGQIR